MRALLLFMFFGFAAQAKPLCDHCNVVVIAIDALQAAHVHHLGGKADNTPVLDGLAARGTTFTQAISPASWTVPTYLSIFSSMFPSQHGLTNRYVTYNKETKRLADFKKHDPRIVTLAQAFKSGGYRTGGFSGDSGVSAVLGYDQGFDVYTDETKFGGLENSAGHALKWLDETKGKPFFLFVHGYDSHSQFALPPGYTGRYFPKGNKTVVTKERQAELREKGLRGEKLEPSAAEIEAWRAWYDGKIADADARVGSFLSELEKRGLMKNTVVVALSDHGTEFFEHGRVDHGHTLYEELIHVPLVIAFPKGVKPGRVDRPVSTLDLFPTLMDVTGLKTDANLRKQFMGKSLAPVLLGKALKHGEIFSETDYRNSTHKRSVRSEDGWKYIMTLDNGKEELYDLKSDPMETRDLAASDKKRLTRLKDELMNHLKEMPAAPLSTDCLPAYPGQCEN